MDIIEAGKIIKNYNELGVDMIDNLYYYSCLLTSGFETKEAIKLISTLKDMWLEDQFCRCISSHADTLFDIYNEHGEEVFDMSTEELLDNNECGII